MLLFPLPVVRGIEYHEHSRDAVPHAVLRSFVDQSLAMLTDEHTHIDRATVRVPASNCCWQKAELGRHG